MSGNRFSAAAKALRRFNIARRNCSCSLTMFFTKVRSIFRTGTTSSTGSGWIYSSSSTEERAGSEASSGAGFYNGMFASYAWYCGWTSYSELAGVGQGSYSGSTFPKLFCSRTYSFVPSWSLADWSWGFYPSTGWVTLTLNSSTAPNPDTRGLVPRITSASAFVFPLGFSVVAVGGSSISFACFFNHLHFSAPSSWPGVLLPFYSNAGSSFPTFSEGLISGSFSPCWDERLRVEIRWCWSVGFASLPFILLGLLLLDCDAGALASSSSGFSFR